uniref:Ig-like domain-containing protein n=1 Tax=Labrus bergylta TaxID=56723 RepID=A0A3Q3M1L9_9LABR
ITMKLCGVIGGRTTMVQGGAAVLHCKLIGTTETLTQISWRRLTRGKPRTDNFYTISSDGPNYINGHDDRFRFIGSFTDKNGTLQLSNVTLMDEGTYTCVFTLFPSGIHETAIPLKVHGSKDDLCVCVYIIHVLERVITHLILSSCLLQLLLWK